MKLCRNRVADVTPVNIFNCALWRLNEKQMNLKTLISGEKFFVCILPEQSEVTWVQFRQQCKSSSTSLVCSA